ncbi:ATP-binding protein, partial [Streptomyces sp. NPDC005526]|uniref:ATP-binding protein n=1 Tax=Streptomyces sp. NPDC005526 TaxID=3156885 RepID=UPI00339FB28B
MTAAQLAAAPREEADQVFPLPPAPGAVSVVRRRVRAVLGGWNLPADAVEDVLLVVSELITNALVHALPPATLRLWRIPVDGRAGVRAAPRQSPLRELEGQDRVLKVFTGRDVDEDEL